MGREGLMDDSGYHGFDWECPEEVDEEICRYCSRWNFKEEYCEERKEDVNGNLI